MKSIVLQLITSGVALGLMGGSAAIHSLHVSGAKELGQNQEWSSTGSSPEVPGGSKIVETGARPAASRESAATVEALEAIVELVQGLKDENEDLRGQLEETSRDLMGMRFRLDSHSESFRPMPVSPGWLREGSVSPGSTLHPLLPPK